MTADLFGAALRAWVRPCFNGPDSMCRRWQARIPTTCIAWCAAFLVVRALPDRAGSGGTGRRRSQPAPSRPGSSGSWPSWPLGWWATGDIPQRHAVDAVTEAGTQPRAAPRDRGACHAKGYHTVTASLRPAAPLRRTDLAVKGAPRWVSSLGCSAGQRVDCLKPVLSGVLERGSIFEVFPLGFRCHDVAGNRPDKGDSGGNPHGP